MSIISRVIVKEDQGPKEITKEDVGKWLCQCGLSKNQPYCDGSHKKTQEEEAGKTYKYSEDGTREEISQ